MSTSLFCHTEHLFQNRVPISLFFRWMHVLSQGSPLPSKSLALTLKVDGHAGSRWGASGWANLGWLHDNPQHVFHLLLSFPLQQSRLLGAPWSNVLPGLMGVKRAPGLLLSSRGDVTEASGSWFWRGMEGNDRRKKSQGVRSQWPEVTEPVETK